MQDTAEQYKHSIAMLAKWKEALLMCTEVDGCEIFELLYEPDIPLSKQCLLHN